MRHISGFISSLLLLCCLEGFAQEKPKTTATDTVKPRLERYGLRLGVDLFKLTRSFYDKDYKGIEFTGDYRLTHSYYAAAEIGNENKTTDEDQLNFTTKGSYLRVGFDYNSHENWLNLENMVYVGLRYGFSTFSQELNSYKIYNPNPYFPTGGSIPSGTEYNGLTAHWAEAVVGIKTEVFKNTFVGFSVRLNKLFVDKQPGDFENLYIPGYNRVYSADFGVGFNYTVSYFLPLYKKAVQKEKEKDDKKKKKSSKKKK